MTTEARVVTRCPAHPSRPAVDICPQCGRPRCAADRDAFGDRGCSLCPRPGPPLAGPLEVLVRAGLAGYGAALVGGWVATQYVGVHIMSLVVPAVLGLAVSAAAMAAAARPGTAMRRAVTVVAAVAALLGTGLGFRLFPLGPLQSLSMMGPPYAAAVVGVLAWPVLFGPVKPRRQAQRGIGSRA